MHEHISKQFDAELESVRSRVLQMGGLVEEQILRAVEALDSGDMERIDKTIADDHRVNALEVGLDEACVHIIARRQPAAGDLRLLITVIKTITDLERIEGFGEPTAETAVEAPVTHGMENFPIEELELGVRSYNCLKRVGIETIGDLTSKSENELVAIPNFGRKSIEEVREALSTHGLTLKGEELA